MAQTPSKLRAQRGGTDEGLPCRIDNGLGIDMLHAPEDIEAWPLSCSRYAASHPLLPLQSSRFLAVLQCRYSLGSLGASMFKSGNFGLTFKNTIGLCFRS